MPYICSKTGDEGNIYAARQGMRTCNNNNMRYPIITQYGSTVYRDCYGLSPLKPIYKGFHHFHFQFATYWTSINMNA